MNRDLEKEVEMADEILRFVKLCVLYFAAMGFIIVVSFFYLVVAVAHAVFGIVGMSVALVVVAVIATTTLRSYLAKTKPRRARAAFKRKQAREAFLSPEEE